MCVACFLAWQLLHRLVASRRVSAADPRPLANQLTAELQLVYRDNVPEYHASQRAIATGSRGLERFGQDRGGPDANHGLAPRCDSCFDAWLGEIDAAGAIVRGRRCKADSNETRLIASPSYSPLTSKSLAVKSPVASVPAKQHDSSLLVKKASPTERGAAGEIKNSASRSIFKANDRRRSLQRRCFAQLGAEAATIKNEPPGFG